MIDKEGVKTASKINSLEGDEDDSVVVNNDGRQIEIKKIYDSTGDFSYSAEWYEDETVYLLSGKLELKEIKKILENMKF